MIWNTGMSDYADDARHVDEASADVVRNIRSQLYKYMRDLDGTRYVDDMAHHALRLAFDLKVLPEARLIYVLRDGRDNVAQMYAYWTGADTITGVLGRRLSSERRRNLKLSSLPRSAWKWLHNYCRTRLGLPRTSCGPNVPGQRDFARTHETLSTVAYQWTTMVEMLEDALVDVPTDRVLRVRYEDLLADTVGQATRIADFCEPNDPARLIEAAKWVVDANFRPDFPPLSPQQWESVRPIMETALKRQGYQVSVNPET